MPHMTRVADRQQQEGVTEALQKSGNGWGGGDTNAAAGRQYSHGTRTALSLGPHCPHNPPPVIVHDCVKPVAPCLVIQHQSVHAIAAQSTFFAPQGPREAREQRVGGLGPGELCTRHKWQGPAPPRTPH